MGGIKKWLLGALSVLTLCAVSVGASACGKDEYCVIGIGTISSLDIEIPATYKGLPVTEIRQEAFYKQVYIESVIIPDSVTSIGFFAFGACENLTIYCEAESQPSGWENNWNGGCTVEWGYKKTA